jgi:hypothetical protein
VSEERLDYARLVRDALRDVPRQALRVAAEEGLPGEHHFYLTFRTTHPGVAVSPALHARHPEEMTIVLQHQFWNLAVGEDAFSVTLRFGGAPERLHVPFAALVAFADPAAGFALRFEPEVAPAAEEAVPSPAPGTDAPGPPEASPEALEGNVVDIRAFRRPRGEGQGG